MNESVLNKLPLQSGEACLEMADELLTLDRWEIAKRLNKLQNDSAQAGVDALGEKLTEAES